mgnify:CR=1 FL=1
MLIALKNSKQQMEFRLELLSLLPLIKRRAAACTMKLLNYHPVLTRQLVMLPLQLPKLHMECQLLLEKPLSIATPISHKPLLYIQQLSAPMILKPESTLLQLLMVLKLSKLTVMDLLPHFKLPPSLQLLPPSPCTETSTFSIK